jgi:glycosyltransferase involved in cell wall biosynthesis
MRNMKILNVSSRDLSGGASIAAYRLHRSLIKKSIDSQMLVQEKMSDDFTVLGPESNLRKYLINPLRPALDHILMKVNKAEALFSSSSMPFSDIVSKINKINPDIVHLHWITGGTMQIEEIAKINSVIVWSLHDMWAFTGGCHYDKNCGLFRNECGNCKILGTNKEKDLSRKTFIRKKRAYSKVPKMTVVATSNWIGKCAKESTLLGDREIVIIPNPIDTNLFRKIDKTLAKRIFGIPLDKKVILFSAMNSLTDSRKGFKELLQAINMVEIENVVFVVAGSSQPKEAPELKYPTYFIPPLRDESSLPLLYNVADVMVVPSLQENLANSIIESLSCGIPVVSFDIGGNSDMIHHKKNGYLAKAIVPEDMALGIEWVVKNGNYKELSMRARNLAEKEFNSEVVIAKYIELYSDLLENK